MPSPYTRKIGEVRDIDDIPVEVGVDFHTVTIRVKGEVRLESSQAGEFVQLYLSACWQAAHQAGEMAAEAVRDG